MAKPTPVRPGVIPPEAPPAAAAAPSLVSRETSDGFRGSEAPLKLPTIDAYSAWIHAGWSHQRSKVYDALTRTAQTNARRWAFCTCCSNPVLQRREIPGSAQVEWRLRGSRCHDRLCTPCSKIRSHDIQRALHARITPLVKPLLVTLTLVSGPKDALATKIDELYKSFRYLRDHPVWGEACKGGAAFLEVTRGRCGDRWHVHFHIIADSKFIDQGRLSAAWKSITGHSSIVWLERPKTGNGVAYSAKYAAKGIDLQVAETPELLDETVMALKGRRLAFCFGDWYGTSFAATLEDDALDDVEGDGGGWQTVSDFGTAAAAALGGDPYFIAALASTPFGRAIAALAQAPPLP